MHVGLQGHLRHDHNSQAEIDRGVVDVLEPGSYIALEQPTAGNREDIYELIERHLPQAAL